MAHNLDGGTRVTGSQHVAENHKAGAGGVLELAGQVYEEFNRLSLRNAQVGRHEEAMAAHVERPAATFLDGLIAPKKAEVERQIEIVPVGGPPILPLGFHLKILHDFGMQVTYFDCQIGTSHIPSGSGLLSEAIPKPLAEMSVSVKKGQKKQWMLCETARGRLEEAREN